MTAQADRQGPERADLVVDLRINVVVVLRPRPPSVAVVIRSRFRAPDELIDFGEICREMARLGMIASQVFDQPFYLRLRRVLLRVPEERVDVVTVADKADDGGEDDQDV